MRNKKRVFVDFAFFDRTGIQQFLEKQARKGWMLKAVEGSYWNFERIEPRDIHYSVAYFPDGADQNPETENRKNNFLELCEHSGWSYLCGRGTMLIFANESPCPLPMETDAAVELDTIHKAAKKEHLGARCVSACFGLLLLGVNVSYICYSPVEGLSEYKWILWVLLGLAYLMVYGFDVFRYFAWRRKALKAAALDGSFIETRSYPFINSISYVLLLVVPLSRIGMTWLGFVIGLALIAFAIILGQIIHYGPDESDNVLKNGILLVIRIIALVTAGIVACVGPLLLLMFAPEILDENDPISTYEVDGKEYDVYANEISLTIEDLMDSDYGGYSCEEIEDTETFLLANYEARQEPRVDDEDQPELRYRVVTVKADYLYDVCVNWLLDYVDGYAAVDAQPWDAETAYQTSVTDSDTPLRWVLCYENIIVELRLDWEPTQEQMKIIAEKLGNS